MTFVVKTAIKHNSRVYRKWVNRGKNPLDHDKIRNSTNKLIKEAKLTYYTNLENKPSDPKLGHKHFWTRKLSTMISLSLILNKMLIYLTNSLQTNELYTIMAVFYRGSLSKDALLSHVPVTRDQIISIINNLSPNKAHGYDGISVS